MPIVLLVHGMGTHRSNSDPVDENIPNITEDFVAGLKEAAENFGIENYDISEKTEIHEFNYSKDLDDVRNALATSANEDEAREKLNEIGVIPEAITKLLNIDIKFDEDEMLYTHWLDVVLYALPHYGEPIRNNLAIKINEIFKDNNHQPIHLICHSLGTAVVHDTLAKIYDSEANNFDDIPDINPAEDKFDTLWMFANVSRLLHLLNDIADPNHSLVTSDPGGCAGQFYNVRHQFDPFTWFKQFDRQMENSTTLENKVIRILNTHDFKEYVSDPSVARHLLTELDEDFDYISSTSDTFKKAVILHKSSSLNINYETLEDEVRHLRDLDQGSIKKVIEAFKILKVKIKQIINEEEE